MDCLFCKIVAGEIPSEKVFENEYAYAFKDIHPNAPVHVLVVPKQHIESINDACDDNIGIISEVIKTIPLIAAQLNLKNGYRVITNCGNDGRQSVHHLHFHILGGKQLADRLEPVNK